MRLLSSALAVLLVACTAASFARSVVAMTAEQSPAERTDTLRRYALDPASALDARITDTPASVLKMFAEAGLGSPTAHTLTAAERVKLSAAFAALPPLHRRVLSERLRSISFLDGMPNTALTSTVNPTEPYRLFDITIRASVLGETVSEFLTQKERTCFDAAGSTRTVSIDAGSLDAIVYVILHEATHVVDSSLGLTPAARLGAQPADGAPATAFTKDVWQDRTTIASAYRDPLLERVKYRATGEVLPIARADAVYAALRRTPFASLYGSSNWHDDVAETVAWYHLTQRLNHPYRIVLRDAGKEIAAYEPMQSPLVRGRFDLMARFYEDGPQTSAAERPRVR